MGPLGEPIVATRNAPIEAAKNLPTRGVENPPNQFSLIHFIFNRPLEERINIFC